MIKIKGNVDKVPDWLDCNRQMVPDFVAKNPKDSPVWEITGAEFSKAEIHTADGISIRFPRVTKIRHDKTWQTSTSLEELHKLFDASKQFMKMEPEIADEMADEIDEEATDQGNSPETSIKKKRAIGQDSNLRLLFIVIGR